MKTGSLEGKNQGIGEKPLKISRRWNLKKGQTANSYTGGARHEAGKMTTKPLEGRAASQ